MYLCYFKTYTILPTYSTPAISFQHFKIVISHGPIIPQRPMFATPLVCN